MSAGLFRSSVARTVLRSGAPATSKPTRLASLSFVRGKATLPDLPCMFLSGPQGGGGCSHTMCTNSIHYRRLWSIGALNLWQDHGTPPQEPPSNLRQLLQRCIRENGCRPIKGRYQVSDCPTTARQLPRRRAHKSFALLGEFGSPRQRRR